MCVREAIAMDLYGSVPNIPRMVSDSLLGVVRGVGPRRGPLQSVGPWGAFIYQ